MDSPGKLINLKKINTDDSGTKGNPGNKASPGRGNGTDHEVSFSWKSMADFHHREEIAAGRASTVYSCWCSKTGMHCAVKSYTKSLLSQGNLQQVHREITLLNQQNGSHPHICRVLSSFEDRENVYLVQEFCERGDVLQMLMDAGGRMGEQATVTQVIYPLLLSLKHIHSYGIVHRDIKPENLFVDGTGVVKLGDFGLAVNLNEEKPVSRIGTLDYMAPEVLMLPVQCEEAEVKKSYNQQVDTWACGILCYELLVGKPPFEVADEAVTCAMIIWSELPSDRSGWPGHLSDNSIDFVQKALRKDPLKRSTIDELLMHPLIVSHCGKSGKPLVNTAPISPGTPPTTLMSNLSLADR